MQIFNKNSNGVFFCFDVNGGAGLLINYCAVDDMTYQYSLYNEIKMQYGCKLFENVKKQQQKYPMGICIYQVK